MGSFISKNELNKIEDRFLLNSKNNKKLIKPNMYIILICMFLLLYSGFHFYNN